MDWEGLAQEKVQRGVEGCDFSSLIKILPTLLSITGYWIEFNKIRDSFFLTNSKILQVYQVFNLKMSCLCLLPYIVKKNWWTEINLQEKVMGIIFPFKMYNVFRALTSHTLLSNKPWNVQPCFMQFRLLFFLYLQVWQYAD